MHRSILGVVKTFMKFLLNLRFDARREIVWELRTIQKHESLRTKRQQRLGRSRTGEFGNGRETVFHPAGDGGDSRAFRDFKVSRVFLPA
jgi:hypothetical protein